MPASSAPEASSPATSREQRHALVVFVHGFGSSPDTWSVLAPLLRESTEIRQDQRFWAYESRFYPSRFRPWLRRRRDEALPQLGESLWSFIQASYDPTVHNSIIPIGHSLGGLVIASMLSRVVPTASVQKDTQSSPLVIASAD
jgi:pimeloyl-ACP methyl ester carboxylesterase